MQRPPSKGQGRLEFDHVIRVFCLSSENTVKSLQWVLDRTTFSDRRYQLFPGTLSDINAGSVDCDLLFMSVDLGQPVPSENLKKIKGTSGLAAFIQPTPQQLLHLSEVGQWVAVAWDGANFEKMAERLDRLAADVQEDRKGKDFVETCRNWLRHQEDQPSRIEWMNAPETYKGPKNFWLDIKLSHLSFGAANSRADVRLPIAGTEEFCVIRYRGTGWVFEKLAGERTEVEYRGIPSSLRPGDYFEIGEHSFHVRMPKKVEEFAQLARKSGVLSESSHLTVRSGSGEQTIADLCKELLYAGTNGELRLNVGLKNGSLFFIEGAIQHAITGAVSGSKALYRILSWGNAAWRFNLDRLPPKQIRTLLLPLPEFTRTHQQWLKQWTQVTTMVPPATLKLKVNVQKFYARSTWNPKECQVIASVCEYHNVRDILNNCPLQDVEIVETLVQMRKQGLIEPYSG